MPPPLALLLCTVFVVWILRYDRGQRHDVSKAFWLPTIWMFSIATKPLAIWLGSGGSDAESGSPLDRLFQSALLLLGIIVLQRRRLNWSRALHGNSWLIVLLGYMMISILWSDIPFSSFKRWIRELSAVVMALVILTERHPRQAMLTLFRRTTYILIPFSLLLIKYYPAYGRGYTHYSGGEMWMGVTLSKNCLGRLALMAAFFLLWTLVRRWQGRDKSVGKYQTHVELFLLLLSLYLFKGAENAYSATAVATMVAGLAAYLGLWWMKRSRMVLRSSALTATLAVVMLVGILTPLVNGGLVGKYASVLGRDETLTSRTEIWEQLMPYLKDKPILGTGFGGFWTTQIQAEVQVNEAHNGYLEVLLHLGVVGLLITCMFVFACGWDARKALFADYDWGSLTICFLVMSVVYNIGEASIDSLTNHFTAMQLFLVLTCQRASPVRAAQGKSIEPHEARVAEATSSYPPQTAVLEYPVR